MLSGSSKFGTISNNEKDEGNSKTLNMVWNMRVTEPEAFQYGHFEHASSVTASTSYTPLNFELNTMILKAIGVAEKA